ncbi:hypothetical protein F5Y00DRAFT_222602 [Daldinia vernicosa]|uniref:uncharacterized protein n=1 Tax=Daldinia vernicosa TaxID=114800 RepID=UPI0020083A9F|nr:uncharacterized protein F5Y00DRAFT_222602 [Daldinia vernicosa]KAI0854242.1 hypothetical protein F5Y00DRAFT_222602 [Daldinia vernicosa]
MLSNRKLRVIETWRAEVKSTQNYCVCSRPCLGSSESTNEASESTSTTSVGIDSNPQSSHQSDSTESTPPVTLSPTDITDSELLGKPTCPNCQLLIDRDVSLNELNECGETGLVRKGSPRSLSGLDKLDEIILCYQDLAADKPKKSKIKDHLLNPITNLKSLGSKTVASSGTLNKGMRSLRSLKAKKSSSPGDNVVSVRSNRPRATEIYAQYRCDASSAESSDDERKRPMLSIEERRDRLRRARSLARRTRA